MSTDITPREANIRLNKIRTNTDERPPEIDMAITAINKNMIRRKPIAEGDDDSDCYLCPSCDYPVGEIGDEYPTHFPFCWMCGQALDWSEPKCKT